MQVNPHDIWPDLPVVAKRAGPGCWRVEFASDRAGNYPAASELISLCSEGAKGNTELVVSRLDPITGQLRQFSLQGAAGLNRRVFIPFKGEDRKQGMCEFRRGDSLGIRVLAFMRPGRELVIATAFRKPPQRQTPTRDKERALEVLKTHELRKKKSPDDEPRGGTRRRRGRR